MDRFSMNHVSEEIITLTSSKGKNKIKREFVKMI